MPIISIIVPVYKVEKYISRCIDSILSQTFTDFEIILVDDGSPDNSGRICDQYALNDSRIKVIHKKNGGLADARNAGLDIAAGDYLGFVDSDDFIYTDMYEKLYEACIKYNSKISMCGRYDVFENKTKSMFSFDGYKIWSSKEAIENLLIWNNIDSSVCDKLFEKSLFNNVRFPKGKYNEDIFIMTGILYNSKKIVHIGESKYYYFHRQESITKEIFTERKMDLIEASKSVMEFVQVTYPELIPMAESFYYKGIIYLLSIIQSTNEKAKYKNSYTQLRTLLIDNMINILNNRYIDNKLKIISILLFTNTYHFIKRIKSIMYKINRNKTEIKYN